MSAFAFCYSTWTEHVHKRNVPPRQGLLVPTKNRANLCLHNQLLTTRKQLKFMSKQCLLKTEKMYGDDRGIHVPQAVGTM